MTDSSARRPPSRRRPTPPSPRLLLPLLLLLTPAARDRSSSVGVGVVRAQFTCDIPTNGCTNGLFSVEKCMCECIPPYCPYHVDGSCTLPSANCGGNPWVGCERGVNCPWWLNPLKDESCTTGPVVPPDLWVIFNTRQACCNSNFPYSDICDATPEPEPVPTKHPTIVAEDDEFEIIPMKFELLGVPDDVRVRDLKDEMTVVLKRILLRLSEKIPNLKITEVEERVILDNRERERNRGRRRVRRDDEEQGERRLEQDVTLYYNVYAVRDEERKFGPLIVREMKKSYDEIVEQIRTFSDMNLFNSDMRLNLCTAEAGGRYTTCLIETPMPTPVPPRPAPTPIVYDEVEEDGGLPGWAIALSVLFPLLFLCCLGYLLFMCMAPANEKKRRENNMFLEEGNSPSRGYRRGESGRSERSKRSRQDEELQIVLANPQPESVADDSFTINTRNSNRLLLEDGTVNTRGTKWRDDPTVGTKSRTGRDPTMYVPGQEDRPDPDSAGDRGDERSGRYYSEDPPLKPKRDPTMYVDGGSLAGDPPLKPQRDPTRYFEGARDASMYGDDGEDASAYVEGGRDPTMYGDGDSWLGDASRSRDPYDDYDSYADYASGAGSRAEVETFATREASVASSRRERKSKKKSRR